VNPVREIRIGPSATFRAVETRNGFAVFERTKGGVKDFIIARQKAKRIPNFEPGSVLRPFPTSELAIAHLDRWAQDPLPPAPVRKPKMSGSHRRNGNHSKRKKDGPGQMFLAW
jgi:hypothetical protein